MKRRAEAAERLQLGGNRRAFSAERRHLLQEVEELDADDPGGAERRAGLRASAATSPFEQRMNSVVVSPTRRAAAVVLDVLEAEQRHRSPLRVR